MTYNRERLIKASFDIRVFIGWGRCEFWQPEYSRNVSDYFLLLHLFKLF